MRRADDFEVGTLGVDWVTYGNANWFVQGTTVHAGSHAAECGNIADNQNSQLEVTIDFPIGGEVTFWHTGSTESNYDFLRFYVDGVQLQQWSGTWGWTYATYPVSPGIHDLRWAYTKDISVSSGSDTVWIDDVDMPGGHL